MYEAVRDTEVGLLLYNELVKLRYENAELKNKLSKFNTIYPNTHINKSKSS